MCAGDQGGSAAALAQLKDVLDRLLDAGELDVYASSREQLESAAALYAPAVRSKFNDMEQKG